MLRENYEPLRMVPFLNEACQVEKSSFERAAERSSDRLEVDEAAARYAGCIREGAPEWDVLTYVDLIDDIMAAEEVLAVEGVRRWTLFTTEEQLEVPNKRLASIREDTEDAFERIARDERAEAQRAQDRADAARERRIEQEARNCMMGLAASNALTIYSQAIARHRPAAA